MLARRRLAAQRLAPETAAPDPVEAARCVLGIQAQDVRASRLALRARVPGLEREVIDGAELIRTWTVRGTAHLIAASDLPLFHTLTGARNRKTFDNHMAKREGLETARALVDDVTEILVSEPLTRASLLERLEQRGRRLDGDRSVNVLMPWLAAQGLIRGTPDGRFRAAEPPPEVDEETALAELGRRYLVGYGPATPADLARWSGLPLGRCRGAFELAGPLDEEGELRALPGTLEQAPPAAPEVLLLPAFDTTMLGWVSREPIVPAEHERRVIPGGGIIRAALLIGGRATAAWKLQGSGRRRKLVLDRFDGPEASEESAAFAAEIDDLARFLELEAITIEG